MTAGEFQKFDSASAEETLLDRDTDRGTWGLALFLVSMTFWIVVFDICRLFF